jgi:S1-C subfamily serine protease
MVAVVALLMGGGLGLGLAGGKLAPAGAKGDTAMPGVAAPAGTPPYLADLVEHVGASVVNIKVTKVERMGGPNFMGPEGFGQDSPFRDFMEKFFGGRMPQMPREHRQQGRAAASSSARTGIS